MFTLLCINVHADGGIILLGQSFHPSRVSQKKEHKQKVNGILLLVILELRTKSEHPREGGRERSGKIPITLQGSGGAASCKMYPQLVLMHLSSS